MTDNRPWTDGEILNADDLRKEFALHKETEMFILWDLASNNQLSAHVLENTGFSLETGSMGNSIDVSSSFNYDSASIVGSEVLGRLTFIESYDEINDSSIDSTRWSASGSITENASYIRAYAITNNTSPSSEEPKLIASGINGVDFKQTGSDSLLVFHITSKTYTDITGGGAAGAQTFIDITDNSTTVTLGSWGQPEQNSNHSTEVSKQLAVKIDHSAGSAYIYDYPNNSPLSQGPFTGSEDLNSLGSWYLQFRCKTSRDASDQTGSAELLIDFLKVNRGDEIASFNFTTVIQDKKSNAQTGFGYFLGSGLDNALIEISNDGGANFSTLDASGSYVDFLTIGSQIKMRVVGSLPKVSDPTVGSLNLPYLTHWGTYVFRK